MEHEIYDIWEVPEVASEAGSQLHGFGRWRLQLFGFIARFDNRVSAEKYAETVKAVRKKLEDLK